MSEPKAPSTRLIHHPYKPPTGFMAPQPGVFKASTVIFPNVAALQARNWKEKSGYTYGLHGTPTTFLLEERIATLEGGAHTLLVPSGLAAITLVDMALLKSGDELLIPDNAYGPGKELARQELSRWGITHRFYDPADAAALATMIGPATKLLWLEAAGSITMEFPDLRALVRVARDKGVITALDNTWGAGLAFNAFDLGDGLGVDISAHALTKFPSGGGDVLMGSVTTCDHDLHLRLKGTHMRMGWGVGHVHWRSLCTQAAGLFSVVFDARHERAKVHAFVDALKLFKLGYSWAGPVSLTVPYDLSVIRPGSAWRGTLVRFSLGLEDVQDLQHDLEAALLGTFGRT
jgi:cystathionine beta-lyase